MANVELYNKLTPIVDELEAKVKAAAETLAQDVKALDKLKELQAEFSPNSADKLAQGLKTGDVTEQGWVRNRTVVQLDSLLRANGLANCHTYDPRNGLRIDGDFVD